MAGDDDIKKLKVTEQLNAAIEKQRRLLEGTTRELNAQYEIMSKMREAVQAAGDLGDPLKKAKESQNAVEDLGKEIEKSGDQGKDLTESLQKGMDKAESSTKNFTEALKKAGKQFPVFTTTALAAASGVIEAFHFATSMTSMLFKGITTLIGGFAKLGISILSIPFKIFDNLVKKAEAGGGGNELAAAYEAVRKQFGDFKQDAAHNVLETAHTIDKEFTQTGLNTWRVFGNLAERIQLVNKVATAMGATFDVVGKEMAEHAGHILAYQKGLGVADENMKDFAQAAIGAGKPVQEVMRETASLSLSMQKQFGGSAKLYSRDMSKMINDVKHFGGVSQKTMVETAVYTRKLGIETDKLLGSLDKFDTFDSAAESAAKLAQTYGVQIDAMQLMSAESPAEQANIVKKAFQEQGIAVDQLDRKNMKYISSLTGWDEATSKALLSNKNMGVSLDKIKDGSALAEKQQLSQADAMKQLAGAIERLTPSGGSGFGGFIKALLKGFNDGVEGSKEFRSIMISIMINIRQNLWKMWQAGFKIGQEFVKAFPGIKEFFGGIAELFNPGRFQKLADGIVVVFKNFFANLTSNPKMALPELIKQLREKFFDFLNGEKPGGSKILDGLKKFADALKHILAGSIKFIMEALRDGFRLITDLMSGKGLKEMGAGASGAKKMIAEFTQPIWEAIKEAWPGLRDAFVGMLTTAWEKIKSSGLIEELWDGLKKYMLFVGLSGAAHGGGAFLLAMAGKISGSILTGVVGKMFDNAGKAAAAKAASSAAAAAQGVPVNSSGVADFNKIFDSKQGGIGADSAKGMSGTAKELDAGGKQGINWGGVLKFLVGLAGVIAIGMVALWAGIELFGDVPTDKLRKGLLVIGGVSVALLPAAGAIALLGKVQVDPKSAAIGIAAIGLGIVAMATAIGAVYGAFSLFKVDFAKLAGFTDTVLTMSKIFAVSGLVVMEAMAIGVLISATGGAAAAAAAAGFAAIAVGVTAMASATTAIIKSLSATPMAADLQPKVDMFVKLLTAVTGFAKVYSDILVAMKPTFGQLLFGDGNDTTGNINAVTDFVKTMMGPPGGLIGLVNTLLDAVKSLGGADEKTKQAGEMFAGMLSAVANLASNLAPPKELVSGGFKLIETGDAAANAIAAAKDYVSTTGNQIIVVVDKIKQFLADIQKTGVTADQMKIASGIGPLIQAAAQIVTALKVPPEMINAAKDKDGKIQEGVFAQMGDVIRSQGNQVREVINSIKDSIKPLITDMGSLNPQQMESIKTFIPLLTGIFSLFGSMSQSMTGILLSKNIQDAGGTIADKKQLIADMVTNVGKTLATVGEQMPVIFKSMQTVATSVDKKTVSEVKTSLGVVKDMVGQLNMLSDMLSNDKIMKIDVGGKLTELSKRVGLGGEGTYTITHKPITITVNLSVQMDAKDIEYGIVNRNGPGGKVVVTYDESARKNNV